MELSLAAAASQLYRQGRARRVPYLRRATIPEIHCGLAYGYVEVRAIISPTRFPNRPKSIGATSPLSSNSADTVDYTV